MEYVHKTLLEFKALAVPGCKSLVKRRDKLISENREHRLFCLPAFHHNSVT